MKNKFLPALLFLLLSASACLQKEITLDFPSSEPRLVLEGLLIDGLPIMMQVSKTTNFNDEAFTFNVPNNTQVWVMKDGEFWLPLRRSEELDSIFTCLSPYCRTFFGDTTTIRLEAGSEYSMQVLADGLPVLETPKILYEGRRAAEEIQFNTLFIEEEDGACSLTEASVLVSNPNKSYFGFRFGGTLVGDPAANFPELNEVERNEIRASVQKSTLLQKFYEIGLFRNTVIYGAQLPFTHTFFSRSEENESIGRPGLCDCDLSAAILEYGEIVEADSSLTNYLLALNSYFDFGDAGLFSRQNLPPIPHNIINGYGYFGLANAYNFPFCQP